MTDTDYILGTHDAEIERLGLQHRVWRPKMLDAWRRGGIKAGQSIIDIGSGPGFATLDLAEIVGPTGRVIALERSERFLDYLRHNCVQRSLNTIEICETDLDLDLLNYPDVDAVWCRWLLSFLQRPMSVVTAIANSLRPGGTAIFHEYLDYGTWRLGPTDPSFTAFVDAVMQSWRMSGGEPDIALELPKMLDAAGMDIVEMRPLIDTVTPDNFVWEWPEAFARINLNRLLELGLIDEQLAQAASAAIDKAKQTKGCFMVTPCVLEVIARKR